MDQRLPGIGGGENGESVSNGDRVFVWEDEKVLEKDGGGICTAMWMHLRPSIYKYINGKNSEFYITCICHNKEKGEEARTVELSERVGLDAA